MARQTHLYLCGLSLAREAQRIESLWPLAYSMACTSPRLFSSFFGDSVASRLPSLSTFQSNFCSRPDAWWTSYGARVPNLQKLAIRVLSQTCSSSGCERNWSVFDKIHSKKRNRLESKRLNDVVYVYYNLRLWVRQLQKPTDVEAISLDNIDTTAAWRVETERPILDTIPDWLGVDLEDVAVAEEGELEIEEEEAEQHQGQEAVAELDEDAEEEVTPSRVGSSSGSVAQRPPLPSASRGRLSPFPFVSSGAGSSSSRGKGNISKKHVLIVSRKLSGLTDLLFNRRVWDQEQSKWQHKHARLYPGKVSPRLAVPEHILKPPYVNSRYVPEVASGSQIHDAEGIACMRDSGQLAARVLEYAGTLVKPGVTTDEIDKAVHKMIIDAGAYPSPLGYGQFPKSVCTSVNECICHGIPDSRPLEDGDIVNIDVTVYLNGYHGDTSKTFFCGNTSEEANQLVKVTEECLHKAIAICGPRVEFKKIGETINDHADKFHYGAVQQFVGHGVGKVFHSDPMILHFRNNKPGRMVIGQTFTIEPMLTIGSIDHIMWNDNWTVVTADGSLSAQFEHTLLITENGVEILTQC